jgi:tRNA-specific 2-thiouridylase
VATGHFAKKYTGESCVTQDSPVYFLAKGVDPSKDQSYFLWTLKQEQLSQILFPVGGLKKTEVRKLAKKFKLGVAEKKDSQGICFLGAIDLKEFLKHYIREKKGKVLNMKGETIGSHDGAVFHTLGERHGFTITQKSPNDRPYYIVSKDVKKNILVVSQSFARQDLAESNKINLKDTNWINEILNFDRDYTAQIRYHGEFLLCKMQITRQDLATIIFQKPVLVASGQSCVLYDGDICLGGGIVV